jgi:murein hydrolase activator
MIKKQWLSILFFVGIVPAVLAQSGSDKIQLGKERQEIQNELKQMQDMYNNVKGRAKLSLGQLNILKKKINLQERYIASINHELKMIDDDIYHNNIEIYRLQKQLNTLKVQYARTVVYAYKNQSSYDYVNFIFSANSFNDAIRRIAYLKSYRAYREKQVSTILETQQLIAKRQQQQSGRAQQKKIALQNQVKERIVLDVQRKEKDAAVSELTSQQKDLQKQITAKKKKDRELKNSILAIVRRDIENDKKEMAKKTAEEERNKVAKISPSIKPVTSTSNVTVPVKKPGNSPELNAREGADFGNNRGKLPWPVDNSFVSIPFGVYTIDGTQIIGDNPGVTIATPSSGMPVKAVFDGEVSKVDNKGDVGTIYIRHGKYYTVYSNLSAINVTRGAIVKRGQVIGRVGEADEGSGGQLDFILMIESKNVNPELWLGPMLR